MGPQLTNSLPAFCCLVSVNHDGAKFPSDGLIADSRHTGPGVGQIVPLEECFRRHPGPLQRLANHSVLSGSVTTFLCAYSPAYVESHWPKGGREDRESVVLAKFASLSKRTSEQAVEQVDRTMNSSKTPYLLPTFIVYAWQTQTAIMSDTSFWPNMTRMIPMLHTGTNVEGD